MLYMLNHLGFDGLVCYVDILLSYVFVFCRGMWCDAHVGGWMGGWVDGWMDGWIMMGECMHACMDDV